MHSYVRTESQDKNFSFRLIALLAILQENYSAQSSADGDTFVINPEKHSTTAETKQLDPKASKITKTIVGENPSNTTGKWLFGIIVAVAAAGGAYWQGCSGSRQASTSEMQLKVSKSALQSESGALFRLLQLPMDTSHSDREKRLSSDTVPFDRTIDNVGKGPATDVRFRCGTKNEHGPFFEVGTIAAHSGYTFHLVFPLHETIYSTATIVCA